MMIKKKKKDEYIAAYVKPEQHSESISILGKTEIWSMTVGKYAIRL